MTIVDYFSRVSPGIWAGFHAKAMDAVTALEKAKIVDGIPNRIRIANGSQFVAKETDFGANASDVILDFSMPGKPTDNAFTEAFNIRFRQEYLNAHWFLIQRDDRQKNEAWRHDFNNVRPQGTIGNVASMELFKPLSQASLG